MENPYPQHSPGWRLFELAEESDRRTIELYKSAQTLAEESKYLFEKALDVRNGDPNG